MDVSKSESMLGKKIVTIHIPIGDVCICSYKSEWDGKWLKPQIYCDFTCNFPVRDIPDLIEALTYAKKAAEEMEAENR